MECNKWEEKGLLFSSGELSGKEVDEFTDHMRSCHECAEEYRYYMEGKKHLFTTDILGDTPSEQCDAEIRRVCSDGRRKVANVHYGFSLVVKRAIFSIALFVAGFTGISYITLKINNNHLNNNNHLAQPQINEQNDSLMEVSLDSTTDTNRIDSVNFARSRGNLDLKGVYPVDLKNK